MNIAIDAGMALRRKQTNITGFRHQGPVSERRLSENSEYVNPEMRETLGFPFQNGRFVKPGKQGKSSPFQKER